MPKLLKYALFNSFDIRLSEKDIVYSDFGKPYLNSQPYKFNVSHSGDWVVCSVGNSKIGVDIEEIKNIDINAWKEENKLIKKQLKDISRDIEDLKEGK